MTQDIEPWEEQSDWETLSEQASLLPYGSLQVSLLEQAVRLAEQRADQETIFRLRNELVQAATFGGRPDLVIVHFAWCLAYVDAQKESPHLDTILWRFKWVISELVATPAVSKKNIEDILEDFRKRLIARGESLHPYLTCKLSYLWRSGEVTEALSLIDEVKKTRRSSLSNCQACVSDLFVEIFVINQKVDNALAEFARMLKRGESCVTVPTVTYSRLLSNCLDRNDTETAFDYHAKSFSKVCKNSSYLEEIGFHLEYLHRIENWTKANRALRAGFSFFPLNTSYIDRFHFLRAAIPYLRNCLDRKVKKLRLQAPKELEHPSTTPQVDLELLLSWCISTRDQIAQAFDTRNENSHYASMCK